MFFNKFTDIDKKVINILLNQLSETNIAKLKEQLKKLSLKKEMLSKEITFDNIINSKFLFENKNNELLARIYTEYSFIDIEINEGLIYKIIYYKNPKKINLRLIKDIKLWCNLDSNSQLLEYNFHIQIKEIVNQNHNYIGIAYNENIGMIAIKVDKDDKDFYLFYHEKADEPINIGYNLNDFENKIISNIN